MTSTEAEVRRPRTGRVLTWALLTVVVAVLVGVAVGVLVAVVMLQLTSDDATNGWAGLAAIVVGVLAGAVAAVVAWAIGLVVGARRYFPPGSRAVAVLLTMGATAVGSAAAIALLNALGEGGGSVTGVETRVLAVVVVVALASAVFPWWERRLARRG